MLRHTINQLLTSAQHLLLLIIGLHVSTDHSVIFRSLICCKFQGAVHTNVCTAPWNLQNIKDLKMTEWSVETCSPIISSNKCCADVNNWLIVMVDDFLIKFCTFFCFVEHASRYIYVIKKQLDALFILSLLRQSTSTCFGHICSPSSIGILCIYQPLVRVVLFTWLSVGRPSFVHFSFYSVRGHLSYFLVAYDYRL